MSKRAGIVDIAWIAGDSQEVIEPNITFFVARKQGVQEMAMAAIDQLMSEPERDRALVSELAFTSTLFENTAFYPHLCASFITEQLGFRHAQSYGIQHAFCGSPFVALKLLARSLERYEEPAFAILVCADLLGADAHQWRPIGASGAHSDAAAAILMSNFGKRLLVEEVSVDIDNARYRGLDLNALVQVDRLYMAFLTRLIGGVFKRRPDIDSGATHLFPNNLDKQAWQAIASRYGIPANRVHSSASNGHMFGADPFVNLASFLQSEQASSLQNALLCASGVGGVFASALLSRHCAD